MRGLPGVHAEGRRGPCSEEGSARLGERRKGAEGAAHFVDPAVSTASEYLQQHRHRLGAEQRASHVLVRCCELEHGAGDTDAGIVAVAQGTE